MYNHRCFPRFEYWHIARVIVGMIVFFGVLFMVTMTLASNGADTDHLPAYLVKYTQSVVAADGRVSKEAWSTAMWSRDFVWVDDGTPAPLRARFKSLYSSEGLRFLFEYECVKSKPAPLDPDLPRACEVFLDPEGRGKKYFEFAVSPEGIQHGMIWKGRLSVGKFEALPPIRAYTVVELTDTGTDRETITYEVMFPWKDMASLTGKASLPPKTGDAWRANFSRVESGEFAGDYVWSPTTFYYLHQPNTFGWLVFAGEKNSLDSIPSEKLQTLPDVSTNFPLEPGFQRFNDTFWVNYRVMQAHDGGYYVVNKCSVSKTDRSGKTKLFLTQKNGLPAFIRSIALTDCGLYIAGAGRSNGLALLDDNGKLHRFAREDGYAIDGYSSVFALGGSRCLVARDDLMQIISTTRFNSPIRASGNIQCVVSLGDSSFVVGTGSGFDLYSANGDRVAHTAIAGGVAMAVRQGDAVLGVSGKNGLYKIDGKGNCGFYPSPLRSRFDRIYVDGDVCWLGYTGGIGRIDGTQITWFDEPMNASGMRVVDMTKSSDGTMVFLCSETFGNWYTSGRNTSFLLSYDGKRWRKKELPAIGNALTTIDGEIFISTNAGVFTFKP